jgi:hypothetical protein
VEAEWILANMPDGINATLRSVLDRLARLPVSSLIAALERLDYEPIPIIKGTITPAPRKAA